MPVLHANKAYFKNNLVFFRRDTVKTHTSHTRQPWAEMLSRPRHDAQRGPSVAAGFWSDQSTLGLRPLRYWHLGSDVLDQNRLSGFPGLRWC